MTAIAILPARLASTRLPGKVLLPVNGKPLIQLTYEAAQKATRINRVIVATPDVEVAKTVRNFGGEAELTYQEHDSGSSRIAEVLARLKPEPDIVVNLQADEPLIHPHDIKKLVS